MPDRLLLPSLLALALLACDGGSQPTVPVQPPGSGSQPAPAAQAPASLWLDARPEGQIEDLSAVRARAAVGEEVTFLARVGGRAEPFNAKRALFVVADPALRSCELIEGDGCKTPWDYCCEKPEQLKVGLATVQLVGDDGKPRLGSLEGQHDLDALAYVVVRGKVRELNDEGLFIVDASGIWVGGKPTPEDPRAGSR